MFLEIITPEKKIYEGEIKQIRVPGTKGLFEILNNHAPIISTLGKGTIRVIDKKDSELTWDITSGIIENKKNKIIVLLETL